MAEAIPASPQAVYKRSITEVVVTGAPFDLATYPPQRRS